MTLSQAKKQANKKWDAENLVTVSVRIRKEKAARFKQAAAAAGTTTGELIRKLIDDTIEKYYTE